MHDPMQAYSALGAYPGGTPFGLPYGAFQTPMIHPALANPWGQTQGISPFSTYGTHPGQFGGSPWQNPYLQNPLITAALQNPQIYPGLHNPILQNPLLHNPMLHNPFVNPIQAQLQQVAQQLALQAYAAHLGGVSPLGVGGSPYGHISPFTQGGIPGISPLAPQTWVGQGGGLGYGQGQSMQPQGLGRGFQTPGISPWAGF